MTQPAQPTQQHAYKNGADDNGMSERAREAAKTTQKAVEKTAHQAMDAGEKFLDEAKDNFGTLQQDALASVRKNPGASLVGALGIGVLLGLALRGRG